MGEVPSPGGFAVLPDGHGTPSSKLELGRLGQPIQLRRKLVVAFEPCAEFSDGDVVLAAIVTLKIIEILRVGLD